MKSLLATLPKLSFVIIAIGAIHVGAAFSAELAAERTAELIDQPTLTCPKMSSFILDHFDDSGEIAPLQNAVTYPIKKEQGGGWMIRAVFAKDSPWNFGDIMIQTKSIQDGVTAWERAKEIKNASLKTIPVLRKHFFNKDHTGSYFYTCTYPVPTKYALSGDSVTVSSTIYTDGIGTSKADNGTESVLYDYFSRQCGDEDMCLLR